MLEVEPESERKTPEVSFATKLSGFISKVQNFFKWNPRIEGLDDLSGLEIAASDFTGVDIEGVIDMFSQLEGVEPDPVILQRGDSEKEEPYTAFDETTSPDILKKIAFEYGWDALEYNKLLYSVSTKVDRKCRELTGNTDAMARRTIEIDSDGQPAFIINGVKFPMLEFNEVIELLRSKITEPQAARAIVDMFHYCDKRRVYILSDVLNVKSTFNPKAEQLEALSKYSENGGFIPINKFLWGETGQEEWEVDDETAKNPVVALRSALNINDAMVPIENPIEVFRGAGSLNNFPEIQDLMDGGDMSKGEVVLRGITSTTLREEITRAYATSNYRPNEENASPSVMFKINCDKGTPHVPLYADNKDIGRFEVLLSPSKYSIKNIQEIKTETEHTIVVDLDVKEQLEIHQLVEENISRYRANLSQDSKAIEKLDEMDAIVAHHRQQVSTQSKNDVGEDVRFV